MTLHFLKSETGAVTVDWVVLTAATVGLTLATMAAISTSTEGLSTAMTDEFDNEQLVATSFPAAPFPGPFTPFSRDDFQSKVAAFPGEGRGVDNGEISALGQTEYDDNMALLTQAIADGDQDFARYYLDLALAAEVYYAGEDLTLTSSAPTGYQNAAEAHAAYQAVETWATPSAE